MDNWEMRQQMVSTDTSYRYNDQSTFKEEISLLIGQRVWKDFKIIYKLGAGGEANVFIVRDLKSQQIMVMKQNIEKKHNKFNSLEEYCLNDESFKNELQLIKLNNQNINPITFIVAIEDDISKGAALAM